jgi:hypothetical protein
MNNNSDVLKIFKCNICNKNYSSQSSLCNHNKKFHTNNMSNNVNNISNNVNIMSNDVNNTLSKKYKCDYCYKICNSRQSKWVHQKICKQKNNTIDNNTINNKTLEKQFDEFKNTILEILQKEAKIHPKTLQKINKQLINNTNNSSINNGTINNGPVINNTYVKFGNEQLSTLLTHKDMLNIINKQCFCIEESIKTVHFNKKLPEYNNIFITNMKDTIAYIFDGSRFILTSKDTVINDLYNAHLDNIEQFLEESEIPENKYSKITKFLDVLNDDDKYFIDGNNNNKKYSNYKAYKLIAIKNLIYNECDQKILKKLNNMDLYEKINDESIS